MAHIFLTQLKATLDNCLDELEQIHFLFSRNPETDFSRKRTMFSGVIPLLFILRMIFASPTTSPMALPRTSPSDSPCFLASSRSSFISSLNASHIFASLLISRYSSSFALTLICENASIFYNPYPSQIISFLTYAAVLKSTTAISVSMIFSLSIIDSIFSIVTPLI